jgi:hypothetical protein
MEFRELSSKMLNPKRNESDVNLHRFLEYINDNEYINFKLVKYFENTEFDFKECFRFENAGWGCINPPKLEVDHVKAIYDYMSYIIESKKSIESHAFKYPSGSNKIIDMVRNLTSYFKPLVDVINGFIAKDLLLLEDINNVTIKQNIHNNYGTANVATGNIHSSNTYNINETKDMVELLKNLINTINIEQNIPQTEREEVIDDIEIAIEQLESTTPKLGRVKSASKRFINFLGLKALTLPSIAEFLELHSDIIVKLKELVQLG